MMPQPTIPLHLLFTLSGGPSNINLACLFKFSPCLLALDSYDLEKTELLHFTPCALIVVRPFSAKLLLHPLFGFRLPPQPCSSIPPNIFSSHANSTGHPTPPENDLPATILPNRLPRPWRRRYPNPPTPYSATNQLIPPPPPKGNRGSTAPATTSDLITPNIKNPIYTTGRGGVGNLAKADPENPQQARLSQDVAPAERREGGAGSFVGRGECGDEFYFVFGQGWGGGGGAGGG